MMKDFLVKYNEFTKLECSAERRKLLTKMSEFRNAKNHIASGWTLSAESREWKGLKHPGVELHAYVTVWGEGPDGLPDEGPESDEEPVAKGWWLNKEVRMPVFGPAWAHSRSLVCGGLCLSLSVSPPCRPTSPINAALQCELCVVTGGNLFAPGARAHRATPYCITFEFDDRC